MAGGDPGDADRLTGKPSAANVATGTKLDATNIPARIRFRTALSWVVGNGRQLMSFAADAAVLRKKTGKPPSNRDSVSRIANASGPKIDSRRISSPDENYS